MAGGASVDRDGVTIRVMRLQGERDADLPLPRFMTEGAAGADVRAALDVAGPGAEIVIPPLGRAMIPTGLALAIPTGWEVQLRPRSGLAARFGVTLLNAPGTIDSDYRGEVKVILVNLGTEDFTVTRGERIAQVVVARAHQATFVAVESLDATTRGAGGFGHTGR